MKLLAQVDVRSILWRLLDEKIEAAVRMIQGILENLTHVVAISVVLPL